MKNFKKLNRTISGLRLTFTGAIPQIFAFLLIGAMTGCRNEYYSIDDFSKIAKYDTHVHFEGTNTGLAEQAKEDGFCMIAISVDLGTQPDIYKQFQFGLQQEKEFPSQVKNITSFDLLEWNAPDWDKKVIEHLQQDFDAGALGLKIWKCIGMTYRDSNDQLIMIDNPRFDAIMDFVVSKNKVVIGHLGEPRNCWLPIDSMTVISDQNYFKEHPQYHMYLHPEFPSYEEQIAARDRFLERNPELTFIGAHLGSLEWSTDELAKTLDKFPNMAVDMAERICHWQHQSLTDREKVRNFIIKYQDRLIYGTDLYEGQETKTDEVKAHAHDIWIRDWQYFVTDDEMTAPQVKGKFRGLKLPREVIVKIYNENARKWFKII
ncbi:MAG: amidohydrolase family protein [Saprospiraceae bacterium]|nr:amidohydrolase family protein [Saprospiraceae bacterium]